MFKWMQLSFSFSSTKKYLFFNVKVRTDFFKCILITYKITHKVTYVAVLMPFRSILFRVTNGSNFSFEYMDRVGTPEHNISSHLSA